MIRNGNHKAVVMGDTLNSEEEINGHIKTLSRGLMQINYSVAYEGYNALYRIGEPVIPFLKQIVLRTDWSNTKYKELSFYLTGLVSLLHDINESEGNQIIQHIISRGCATHVRALLHSLSQFSEADFTKCKIRDITVLTHKDITAKCNIKPYIDAWLANIPEHELRELVRIFIVRPEDMEAIGTYTPLLCKITIAWDNAFKINSFLFKLFLLSIEHTFYHEIGHHSYRHTFGQDPVQEKEADDYASRIMTKAHPKIGCFVKVLRRLGILKKK
jgi:hypothetical protein